ncbi:MAG: uroporphyrinogen decarboxylase family protein [Planctomycetota bacterium]
MNSRERVLASLNHREPDRCPLDLGSTGITGIAASAYYSLLKVLGLPQHPPRVYEVMQMLADVEDNVLDALGVDVARLSLPGTTFGFPQADWKPWTLFDGTPVLVPGGFNTEPDKNGDILQYPRDDRSAPPSGRMPRGGYYFDAIVRQEPIDYERLDPREWLEGQLATYSDEQLSFLEKRSIALSENAGRAIVFSFGGGSFGDIARVPGPSLPRPRGIRRPDEWYMVHLTHPEYIRGIFTLEYERAMGNLKLLREALDGRIQVITITGADFGTQRGLFISPDLYRDLYQPLHKRLNDWVHANTSWKTFLHSCGSVRDLIPDFIDAGFDCLNPVQCSAAGMEAGALKREFGDRIVFWGGGVDTQKTLPFGTPEDVSREVAERTKILGEGGGFIFAAIHNIQAKTPPGNLRALFDTFGRNR